MPVEGTSEIVSELIEVCGKQAENPPLINDEPDKGIARFAVAFRSCLEVLPESSQEQLAGSIKFKNEKGPYLGKPAFDFIMRHVQMNLGDQPTYPYATQREWDEQVAGVLLDEKKFHTMTIDMMMWSVGTDVETRVAGMILVAQTLLKEQVDDLDHPFSILNVGCSRNHSLAMLSSLAVEYDNLELPEIEIVGKGLGQKYKQFLQDRVNELMAKKIVLGDSYGVDVRDIRDKPWGKFLEYNCHPSELRDPVKRRRYYDLEVIRDDDEKIHQAVGFYGRDKIDVGGNKANLVAFSTCLYQSYRDIQRNMVDQGLVDGDFVMIQDFGKVISSDTSLHPIEQLEITGPSSKPYTYGLFAYDPKTPELGVRTLGYWNNGRCEKFLPTKWFCELLEQQTF